MEDLQSAPNGPGRLVIVGSITGNSNTLAGNIPPKADLGDLRGLASGLSRAPMINGGEFDGAKAYKDSKVGLLGVWQCACPSYLVLMLGGGS